VLRDRHAPHRRKGHVAERFGTTGSHGDALHNCAG
jgi:hypothetical protein